MLRMNASALCLFFVFLLDEGMLSAGVIVFNSTNGHHYELVSDYVTWGDANAAANAKSYNGVTGHLVTVTSAAENKFLTSLSSSMHALSAASGWWMGGYQPQGSAEPAGGWSWVTGEPFVYNNWFPPSEPNNFGNQDSIMFAHLVLADGKAWDDFIGTNNGAGYIVEYDTPLPSSATVPEPGYWVAVLSAIVVCRAKRSSLRLLQSGLGMLTVRA